MKKILLTIALVAGGLFFAQAQYSETLPALEAQFFNDNAYALVVGDNVEDRCVVIGGTGDAEITEVGTKLIYRIDANGQMYRNGLTFGTPNIGAVATFNAGTYNRLATKQSNNTYTLQNIQ